ncbi:MAG: signal peptidase I [Lachnospiraceae bacterium]|nr:signal peptidase I [Lachnospiraceae bacterium]
MTAENRENNKLREAEEDALADILAEIPEPEEPEDTLQDETEDTLQEEPDEVEETLTEEDSAKLEKELVRAEKGMKNAQRFLIYLLVFLAIIWILFFKIIGITHMPTEGMEPRIDAGDLLVFYRLDREPKFRDVIVFEADIEGDGTKTLMVGRVMAAPGDTVDINEYNRLVVNGNVIAESESYIRDTAKRGDRVKYPLTLGEDEYFILSDNRTKGVDSRYFGPVTKKDILGTIITLFRRNKL